MHTPRVLISILNWNKADETLHCLASLRNLVRDGLEVDILVIDNGSKAGDYEALRQRVDAANVEVVRLEHNLGFTGGHNVSLKRAMQDNYDFIWLLNNDSTAQSDTLAKLIKAIAADERCGAVSPVIVPDDGSAPRNAWSFSHEWQGRGNPWAANAAASQVMHETDPFAVCLAGTAIVFRVQAIREVGILDDRLFAYYDDNDIGTRLSRGGWLNKVVFDASATHGTRLRTEQPLYFFYLMSRNELIFWYTHMPQQFRRFLWLKLVNQGMYYANRLRHNGLNKQADTALLGVWDFMRARTGAPDLTRKVPLAVRLACGLLNYKHSKQIRRTERPLPSAA